MVPRRGEIFSSLLEARPELADECNEILRKKKNLSFDDFHRFLLLIGFEYLNKKGSHYNYKHPDCHAGPPYYDRITAQEDKGKAKGYQVGEAVKFVYEAEYKRRQSSEQ